MTKKAGVSTCMRTFLAEIRSPKKSYTKRPAEKQRGREREDCKEGFVLLLKKGDGERRGGSSSNKEGM